MREGADDECGVMRNGAEWCGICGNLRKIWRIMRKICGKWRKLAEGLGMEWGDVGWRGLAENGAQMGVHMRDVAEENTGRVRDGADEQCGVMRNLSRIHI